MNNDYLQAIQPLIAAGQWLYQQGWAPATSGNYSLRVSDQHFLVTVSGKHKGQLTPADFIKVDLNGNPLIEMDLRPSAETLLHAQLYRSSPTIGAVLHTHSVTTTVLSRLLKNTIELCGYEMLKAFSGLKTHEEKASLPIVENSQDMPALAALVERASVHANRLPAYLIRGHGTYVWGKTLEDVLRHVEALEFILACELKLREVQG